MAVKSLFLILIVFPLLSMAAPAPVTSSSLIISAKPGLYFSKFGFQISSENTNWKHIKPRSKNKYILTEYINPEAQSGIQSAFSVRVDPLNKKSTLKKYIKRWESDYTRFVDNN